MMPEYHNIILSFILGICLGSFLEVLISRLRSNDFHGFVSGRSHCDHCKKKLSTLDLIPIVSWVILKGKCRYCHATIPRHHLMLELSMGSVFTLAFVFAPSRDIFSLSFLLCSVFLLMGLFWYDVLFHEVDDRVIAATILIAFGYTISQETLFLSIAGGVIGFIIYAILGYVSKYQWVGSGDMRLGLVFGLFVGASWFLPAFFIANLFGTLIGGGLILFSRKFSRESHFPVGGFLIPIVILFLLWGGAINKLFWELFSI